MNLQVVSACFYADKTPARRLIQSCERFGLPLHLYGVGEPCKSWYDAKIVRLRQELERLDCDFVLFVDAADTIIVSNPVRSEMYDMYSISGERNCWPDGSIASSFSRLGKPRMYPYPNAGGIYGPRTTLIECLHAIPQYSENDQECWHRAMVDRKIFPEIDDNATIFQTMDREVIGGTLAKRSDGRLVNLYTMTTPSVIHFNGGNKEARMQEFEDWFNG